MIKENMVTPNKRINAITIFSYALFGKKSPNPMVLRVVSA